jgi:hypothetical protein
MEVLVTGAGTTYGNGWADVIAETNSVTCFGESEHPSIETIVADRRDYDAVLAAVEGVDAVVDLPVEIENDSAWEPNHRLLQGSYNLLRAAAATEVEQFILGSTNKVVQGYEVDHAPTLYDQDVDFTVDHTMAPRPTDWYAVSRLYAEYLAQMYTDRRDWQVGRHTLEAIPYPEQIYVLRWGSVRLSQGMDHPYSDAEYGVENGFWDSDSEQYELAVKRMKATWLSRADLKHLLERVFADDSVRFDVFYGVSANDRRWLDIQHAKEVLGYDPVDNGEEWTEPPN